MKSDREQLAILCKAKAKKLAGKNSVNSTDHIFLLEVKIDSLRVIYQKLFSGYSTRSGFARTLIRVTGSRTMKRKGVESLILAQDKRWRRA